MSNWSEEGQYMIVNGRVLNRKRDPHPRGITKLRFAVTPPIESDLRPLCPPIYDQGQFGSCTAQAWIRLMEFLKLKEIGYAQALSRAMFYDCERIKDGTFGLDEGSYLSTGAFVAVNIGSCSEALSPYNQRELAESPSDEEYKQARPNRIPVSHVIEDGDADSVIARLAQGIPVVCGISVHDSFFAAVGGRIPMPGVNDAFRGGHAICLVGFQKNIDCFIFANSWSVSWGDAGHGYLPRKFVADSRLCSDLHTS